MRLHVDAAAMENYAFRFQPETLLERRLPAEQYLAPRADDAMPGQPSGILERPHHLPGRAGKASRARDIAVGGDLALRYPADRVANDVEHGTGFAYERRSE